MTCGTNVEIAISEVAEASSAEDPSFLHQHHHLIEGHHLLQIQSNSAPSLSLVRWPRTSIQDRGSPPINNTSTLKISFTQGRRHEPL